MRTRWFFRHPDTDEVWIVDSPKLDDRFHGWIKERGKKIPSMLFNGKLLFGKRQIITQNATVKCSYGCKHAMPWTDCKCICGGKSHGVEYRGPYHVIEETNPVMMPL